MKFTRRQVIILLAGVVLVAGLLFLFYYVTRKPSVGPVVTLSVWGVDDATAVGDLGAAYTAYRPNVTVTYTQVDPAQYETKLLKAFAAGTGPDVFEVLNRSLGRWKSALAPLPTSSTQFSVDLMNQEFPGVAADDFTSAGRIYAVPLSIDTLAMFYNKDYFDSAGIALPPTTWDDFDAVIPKLRQLDAQGRVVRAAVALGGTRANMANANDLVALMMLQNGTQMVSDDRTYATFANGNSGQAAVNFYLQFSNAGSPYYTWNSAMGDALQSFAQGNTAIYFGYHADLAAIQAKAPFLNVGVAPIPQPSGSTVNVNYPKYYGLAASKTGQTAYAWDFILYSTIYPAGENLYLKDTSAPAAQRQAIQTQETPSPSKATDVTLPVFAGQALSAKSWYEPDDEQADAAFDTMLQNILNGAQDVPTALRSAEDAVTATMGNK
jgi:multiple sugar transport system substrate-binding protein